MPTNKIILPTQKINTDIGIITIDLTITRPGGDPPPPPPGPGPTTGKPPKKPKKPVKSNPAPPIKTSGAKGKTGSVSKKTKTKPAAL